MADDLDIERLIERLEAAHDKADSYGAIRYHKGEFNAEIATALWGERRASGSIEGPQTLVWWDGGVGRSVAPDFVGSLDAALMLVPRDYAWSVQSSRAFPGQAWLYPPNNVADIQYQADASSAPLALCIAALRARLSAAIPDDPR